MLLTSSSSQLFLVTLIFHYFSWYLFFGKYLSADLSRNRTTHFASNVQPVRAPENDLKRSKTVSHPSDPFGILQTKQFRESAIFRDFLPKMQVDVLKTQSFEASSKIRLMT